jgi:hypothetical protein
MADLLDASYGMIESLKDEALALSVGTARERALKFI